MRRFKIKGTVVLGFATRNDQVDRIYRAADFDEGVDVVLETDGKTIWVAMRAESITTPNLIDVALKRGEIEEIHG